MPSSPSQCSRNSCRVTRDPHRGRVTHSPARAGTQTQATGSKYSILLFLLFSASFPFPELSMPPCGPWDKWPALAPEGKATRHRGGRELFYRAGYRGGTPSHETSTQGPIHQLQEPSSDALCPFPIDLITRGDFKDGHAQGMCLLFLSCVPLWHKLYKVEKVSLKACSRL